MNGTLQKKNDAFSLALFFVLFFAVTISFLIFMPRSGEFQGSPPGILVSYPPEGSDIIVYAAAGIMIFFMVLFQVFFMKKLKNPQKVIATIFMILLFFAYIEIALSVYSKNYHVPNKPHPVLIWTRDDVPLNSHGLDNPEFPRIKEPGEYRVIIAGDSSAAGQGVLKPDRFSSLMEKTLQKKYPDRKIRIINAAFPGYSIFQIKNLVRMKIRDLSPDLLIVAVNNDTEDSFAQDKNVVPPEGIQPVMNILYNSRLYLLIRKEIVNREFKTGMEKRKPMVVRVSPEDRESAYTQIISDIKGAGGNVLIVAMPSRFPPSPRFDRDKEYKETLEKLAGKQNVYFIDFYHRWKSMDSEKYFIGGEDYIHPNTEGHRAISEGLCDFLENKIKPSVLR